MWRVSCNCAIQSPPQAIQTASQGQAAVAASGAQNPATAPAAKSPAQYPSTDQVLELDFGAFICWTASEYPGDLPVLVAFFAAVVGWFSANYFTARVKRIDATLEFNKRFHELIERQDALNRKYEEDKIRLEEEGNRNPRDPLKLKAAKNSLKCSEKEGVAWWWEFFDLLLHEFDFWHQNLVTRVRFLEWMVWRWADSASKRRHAALDDLRHRLYRGLGTLADTSRSWQPFDRAASKRFTPQDTREMFRKSSQNIAGVPGSTMM